MKEGRKLEYPEKTPGDKLQKMSHTNAQRFKPQTRLKPAQQHWWQARKADVLTITPRVTPKSWLHSSLVLWDGSFQDFMNILYLQWLRMCSVGIKWMKPQLRCYLVQYIVSYFVWLFFIHQWLGKCLLVWPGEVRCRCYSPFPLKFVVGVPLWTVQCVLLTYSFPCVRGANIPMVFVSVVDLFLPMSCGCKCTQDFCQCCWLIPSHVLWVQMYPGFLSVLLTYSFPCLVGANVPRIFVSVVDLFLSMSCGCKCTQDFFFFFFFFFFGQWFYISVIVHTILLKLFDVIDSGTVHKGTALCLLT